MRKLTGLFIAAAVAGTAWWQFSAHTGRSLSAQTGRVASGLFGRDRSDDGSSAAREAARRLMRQAVLQARQGNAAEARRLALQASRFPMEWRADEMSPAQLLAQLSGRSVQPSDPTATQPLTGQSRSPQQPAFGDGQMIDATVSAAGQSNGPNGGNIVQSGFQPGDASAVATPDARDAWKRSRVDQHMEQAQAALAAGDTRGAMHKARVAAALAEGLSYAPGEMTPARFVAQLEQQSGGAEPVTGSIAGTAQAQRLPLAQQRAGALPGTAAGRGPAGPQLPSMQGQLERQQGLDRAEQRKTYARQLMTAAQQDLATGKVEAAYEKALMASEVEAVWDVFEETPSQLIASIERQQRDTMLANQTPADASPAPSFDEPPQIAQTGARPSGSPNISAANIFDDPQAGPATQPTAPGASSQDPPERQLALRLLSDARQFLREGRVEEARGAALKAQSLPVTYSLFDDKPETVLRDIDRQAGTITLANQNGKVQPASQQTAAGNPFAGTAQAAASMPQIQPAAAAQQRSAAASHEKSQSLLTAARQALRDGDYQQARDLAQQAEQLGVVYQLLDDRPGLVLADVDRLERQAASSLAQSTTPRSAAPSLPEFGGPADATAPTLPGSLVNPFTAAAESQKTPAPSTQPVGNNPLLRPDSLTAQAGRQPVTNPATASAAGSGQSEAKRQQAAGLLAEARNLVQRGQLAAAREKTMQAEGLNVIYGLFDDKPQDVLADIELAESRSGSRSRMVAGNNGTAPVIEETSPLLSNTVPSSPNAATGSSQAAQAAAAEKTQARQLLSLARAEFRSGNFDAATAYAEQSADMPVTWSPLEDRPELLQAEIAQSRARQSIAEARRTSQPELADAGASGSGSGARMRLQAPGDNEPFAAPPVEDGSAGYPVAQTGGSSMFPSNGSLAPAVGSFSGDSDPYDNITTLHPSGVSAESLFRQGQALLKQGDSEGAYQAFLEAYQSGQRLDAWRSQQLQDYLRDLAPRRQQAIQLASGEFGPDGETGTVQPALQDGGLNPGFVPGGFDASSPIDIAAQRDTLRLDRLRNEVYNAVLRADSMKERRPDEAIQVLDDAMANVENSGFTADEVSPLVGHLRRSRGSIEGFIAQRQPIIDLERRNAEVKADLDRSTKAKVRVEQEFAELVDEFNRLYKRQQFAEAEVVAKQAKALDPYNPVAVNLELKSKFARRNADIEQLKDDKERSFYDQLWETERAAVVNVGDNPIDYGENWAEITARRTGRYQNDARLRTEEDKRVIKSLNNRISLHFDNTPLIEVIKYIRGATGVNVVVDATSIEEEGITTATPVSIDVDNIMVQSALNLLLGPLNLGYSVENEALNITSVIRQQGRLVPAAYQVADLVVPMRSKSRNPMNVFTNNMLPMDGQMSVAPVGGVQNTGQFQVAPGMGGAQSPFMMGSPGGLQSELSGPSGEQYDFDTLIDLITSVVEPDSWQEVGGAGMIRPNETTLSLVIRQTQQVHQEISDLLDQLRRLQDLQVTIEVRLVNVSDNFFERIGIDFDFDLQDTVGGPNFNGGGGQQQGGGGGNNQQQSAGAPLPPFGTVIGGQQQQAGQNQGGQQNQQAGAQQTTFTPGPRRELTDRDNYPGSGTIIGLAAPDTFTPDLDVAFNQGSFDIGVPDFGNFRPDAGISVGLAILSDIETFFFIQAAQVDERANLLFAPKVTLFNGDTATIFDQTVRPFVLSLQPTVGAFSVGFSPQIGFIPDGITLTVTAVVSADRRFVRLALAPFFNNLIEVQTFSFLGGQGVGGAGGGGGGLGQGGGGFGGQGGGQRGGGGGFQGGFGVGGIGGGPQGMASMGRGLGRFGRPLSGMGLGSDDGSFGAGGIFGGGGGGGFGGGGGGFGGGGGNQQGNQQGGLANTTATVQQPVIATISVQTSVSVPDGGTVLLGGIKRLREGRNMAGVPILNKIPYISRLFKNSGVGRETSSLMLMVTPRIVIHEEEQELLGIEIE